MGGTLYTAGLLPVEKWLQLCGAGVSLGAELYPCKGAWKGSHPRKKRVGQELQQWGVSGRILPFIQARSDPT